MAEVRGDMAVKRKMDVIDNALFHKGLQSPYLEMVDQKLKGVDGGTFTAENWRTRDLNNVVFNDFASSVMSHDGTKNVETAPETLVAGDGARFVLPAGIYFIDASVPAHNVGEHVARLADVTDYTNFDAPTVVLGTSEYSVDTSGWTGVAGTGPGMAQTRSMISGRFQLARSTTLEIHHLCKVTQANDGFGSDAGFYVTDNLFTTVRIWQVRADS